MNTVVRLLHWRQRTFLAWFRYTEQLHNNGWLEGPLIFCWEYLWKKFFNYKAVIWDWISPSPHLCLSNAFCASNVIIGCTVIHTKTQITNTVSFHVHVFSHAVRSAERGLMTHSDQTSYLLHLILTDCLDGIPHPVFKLLPGLVNLHTWDRGNKKLICQGGAWILVKIFSVSILKRELQILWTLLICSHPVVIINIP